MNVIEVCAEPPTWTDAELLREHERRLAEDLHARGSRPRWWRRSDRRRYDREVRYLQGAHARDLRAMRSEADPQRRALYALMIGWWPELWR